MCHNDANNMITPQPRTPYYMRHCQIFNKIDSFLKIVSNVLDSKKVDYAFEEPLNLDIIVGWLFFSSVLNFMRK